MEKKPDQPPAPETDSLEDSATVVEGQADTKDSDPNVISAESSSPVKAGAPYKPSVAKQALNGIMGANIYLMLFIFVLAVAGVVVFFSYNYSKKKSGIGTVATTNLTQNQLNQLANNDVSVGGNGQVLNVQSSAVFAGKILARSDLEVAGNLVLGGTLNLPNLNVTNSATLSQLTVSRNLAVSGDAAFQGGLTIAKSLQVGGSGNFSGPVTAPQISTNSLQLNNDLVLTHHITAGGGTPGRTPGGALGAGGTASVSGSDTAGSIAVNTGAGTSAGCLITVNFTTKFNATPHVLITPVGSSAGGLAYYVNRSSGSFSVCLSAAAPAGASFGFDYFVLD